MIQSSYKIFTGSSHPALAQEIADCLGMKVEKMSLKRFACGEIYVRPEDTVRGKEVFIVQTCTNRVNEDLMELFLICSVMKMSFARKVHVVLPHMGYARQDRVSLPREPISAKLMADLLVQSGADHVITFTLHSDQIQGFFDVPVDNAHPRKLFVDYLKKKKISDPIIVSPDEGGAKAAKKMADELECPMAIMHKSRSVHVHNVSEITHTVGDIGGKTAILYDDMVDTAGSVCNAKEVLVRDGARGEVYLIATHPIFSPPAIERLAEANFKEIIVSNSIPTQNYRLSNLTTISIAPLVAEIIRSVMEEKSVSNVYF
jgi:ribose-phosphate pyrophosphokinase